MQYLTLRKEAASRLTLLAAIAKLIEILALPVMVWFLLQDTMTTLPAELMQFVDVYQILSIVLIAVMLPFLGVLSLPVIALLMIYANARTVDRLKTTGYTILHGFSIAGIVCCSLVLIISLLPNALPVSGNVSVSFSFSSTVLTYLLSLIIYIAAERLTKALQEIARYGATYRRFPTLLIFAQIAALLPSAVQMVLIVLANTIPSMTERFSDFRLPSAAIFYSTVAYSVLTLAVSVLFIFLCWRCRKVLSCQKKSPSTRWHRCKGG